MIFFARYTWWVAGMAALAVLLTVFGQLRVLQPVESVVLTVAQPFERVLGGIFRPVASLLTDAGDLETIRSENRQLRLDNERLQNEVAELQRESDLARELREALKITRAEAPNTRLAANVVHRDASAGVDLISIDRGEGDGIREGMAVLSPQGTLLGTVTKTLNGQSFVRLVTDSRSRVNAKATDSPAEGLVRGGLERGITFDFARADIRTGDLVVTSGLGGNYPPGIPIARVTDVSGTPQDLFRKVALEPLVRVSTVQTVLVLTSFLPQRLELND